MDSIYVELKLASVNSTATVFLRITLLEILFIIWITHGLIVYTSVCLSVFTGLHDYHDSLILEQFCLMYKNEKATQPSNSCPPTLLVSPTPTITKLLPAPVDSGHFIETN